jgi:hypothetical protein
MVERTPNSRHRVLRSWNAMYTHTNMSLRFADVDSAHSQPPYRVRLSALRSRRTVHSIHVPPKMSHPWSIATASREKTPSSNDGSDQARHGWYQVPGQIVVRFCGRSEDTGGRAEEERRREHEKRCPGPMASSPFFAALSFDRLEFCRSPYSRLAGSLLRSTLAFPSTLYRTPILAASGTHFPQMSSASTFWTGHSAIPPNGTCGSQQQ